MLTSDYLKRRLVGESTGVLVHADTESLHGLKVLQTNGNQDFMLHAVVNHVITKNYLYAL